MADPAPAGIIAAGGRGERFGFPTPKQFLSLRGRPLLAWSIDALRAAGCAPLVVVVPPGTEAEAEKAAGARDVVVCTGGDTRQRSVARGLARVSTTLVVVHDAARPLAPPELVRAVIAALRDADAAVAGVPAEDTLKRVRDGVVERTVDRSHLWRVQTPQAFETRRLRAAHEAAAAERFEATDDAQLVERYGGRVVVVDGVRTNIKLTYAQDWKLAEALLGAP